MEQLDLGVPFRHFPFRQLLYLAGIFSHLPKPWNHALCCSVLQFHSVNKRSFMKLCFAHACVRVCCARARVCVRVCVCVRACLRTCVCENRKHVSMRLYVPAFSDGGGGEGGGGGRQSGTQTRRDRDERDRNRQTDKF